MYMYTNQHTLIKQSDKDFYYIAARTLVVNGLFWHSNLLVLIILYIFAYLLTLWYTHGRLMKGDDCFEFEYWVGSTDDMPRNRANNDNYNYINWITTVLLSNYKSNILANL